MRQWWQKSDEEVRKLEGTLREGHQGAIRYDLGVATSCVHTKKLHHVAHWTSVPFIPFDYYLLLPIPPSASQLKQNRNFWGGGM